TVAKAPMLEELDLLIKVGVGTPHQQRAVAGRKLRDGERGDLVHLHQRVMAAGAATIAGFVIRPVAIPPRWVGVDDVVLHRSPSASSSASSGCGSAPCATTEPER